jgi:hypothetical protein
VCSQGHSTALMSVSFEIVISTNVLYTTEQV